MTIILDNGRIDLDALKTIEDHLRALSLANRTLDSIKQQLKECSEKDGVWFRKATNAHKTWFWMRSRICEQLSILRQQEKEMNRIRWNHRNEFLVRELQSRVSNEIFSECARAANARADIALNAKMEGVK
ncbi:hypothetical protein [Xenorhabdus bovienii]|uniref:Flagellar FliJ protein n=1 Tax=Xenorhabdus bovienii str. kraussei Becker Underwood TaxID=1398204 RepID=A0A077PUS2_XENBV|nr:hypothetical protein [Xenorhabdus bovienii]CDH24437.1 conserved hypothetical protein [Xenorhabdus bovienii str. kraussei Becker Underwood]